MKDIFGILGAAFLFCSCIPYIVGLYKKTARPHAFTWILWALINAVVFAAQLSEGAGAGAWAAGVTALVNTGISIHALMYSKIKITRFDWAVFLSALCAIPLWALTKDPMWSVILVCIIDTVAFAPTIRKSWNDPYSDVVMTFVLGFIGFCFAIAAIENYILTNWLYPAVVLMTNVMFVSVLLYRRRVLKV